MSDVEGIIKYCLNHTQQAINLNFSIHSLNAWRTVLFKLGLIGQDSDRYDGLGFGNISQRLDNISHQFVITGSQTGMFDSITRQQMALVLEADIQQNYLRSIGFYQPSSESLTHASLCQLDMNINAVIHVHSPTIWRHTKILQLPHISAEIPYGTVQMANEVKRLYHSGLLDETSLFTMLGHEDGVVAFGETLEAAALKVIRYLALSLQFE